MVERHFRPTILLSVDGGRAKGSARSIPGFDLVAALDATSEHLGRYGGHRAAAGLELSADRSTPSGRRSSRTRRPSIDPADLVRTDRLDALVGVGRDGIGMDLARQLETLGPFGMGNPGPRLLVPSGRLREVRPLGEEGKHSRFQLESGAGRAVGVAFGMNGEISRREDQALDLSDRARGRPLERRGAAASRRPRALSARAGRRPSRPAGPCGDGCPAADGEWWARLEHELARVARGPPRSAARRPGGATAPGASVVDRRGGAAVASLAELISSGESVLAICADAARRAKLASSAADPRRFGAALPRIACCRCGAESLDATLREAPGAGLALVDWTAIARRPQAPRLFSHVVVIDPAAERGARGPGPDGHRLPPSGLGPGRAGADRAAARPGVGAARLDRRDLARALRDRGRGGGRGAAHGARRSLRLSRGRRRPPPAACVFSASSACASGGPIAAPPRCGSYPRRGPIWGDPGPTRTVSPDTRRPSDSCEAEHRRSEHREGRGARRRPGRCATAIAAATPASARPPGARPRPVPTRSRAS